MIPVSIIVNTNNDLHKITSHPFYNHIKDITSNNITSFTVNTKEKNTETIGLETIENIVSQLVVTFIRDNKEIKRELSIKTTIIKKKIHKNVIRRRNMKKFGNVPLSNDGTKFIGEEEFIESSESLNNKINSKNVSHENLSKLKKNPNIKFSQRQKTNKNDNNSKYIPPQKKNKANNQYTNKNKYTIFISGFNEYFTRNEFINMIPNNFRILRFSLPSNDKNRCKGIGFIDVDNKETMKDIIQYFDGMLYNNMVLHANEKFYK